MRVELVKEFVKKRFPTYKLLEYALAVETVTTSKKDNLILNVDGCVAVCFVDLLRNCGAFTPEEAEDYLKVTRPSGICYIVCTLMLTVSRRWVSLMVSSSLVVLLVLLPITLTRRGFAQASTGIHGMISRTFSLACLVVPQETRAESRFPFKTLEFKLADFQQF